jgi:glycosyltransferase involved in cell wall biosynthesis
VTEPLPVSVVIPAYNRPEMVARAVRSALEQCPQPPAEVIVVDDCSTDDTGAVAAAAGATVIRHERSRGGAAARNTAIRAASHEWIAFLDSDDEFLPDHLACLWPERNGHVILGSSAIACAEDPAHDVLIGRAGRAPQILTRPASVLRHGNVLVTSSVIVRRDVAIAAGLFTEGMKRSADLDLWLRVLERGTGYVSPHVTVRYHRHSGQVTDDLSKTFDAYAAIVHAYRDRARLSRTDRAGFEARVVWDRLRLDLRLGRRRAALEGLWRLVRDPLQAPGLLDLLFHRFALRRRVRAYTRAGAPTIRVWTANEQLVDDAARRGLPVLEPLEPRGFWEVVSTVLHRPAGVTITDGRARELAARAGGSRAIRVRPGDADALDRLPS